MSPGEILAMMVRRFHERFDAARYRRLAERGMTLNELVTLASIVEKETAVASERPVVAAVFYNRLRLGMPLQSDPTVIYGLPDFSGNLTRADLVRPNPFNTYVVTRPAARARSRIPASPRSTRRSPRPRCRTSTSSRRTTAPITSRSRSPSTTAPSTSTSALIVDVRLLFA